MKLGSSFKSFLAFLAIFTSMVTLAAVSSPGLYLATSMCLTFADKIFHANCMPLATSLLVFPAEHNSTTAQSLLGKYYCIGMGVEQNYDLARKWLRKAAEHGDAGSQQSLGYLYMLLPSAGDDKYAESRKWFEKSSSQGSEDSPWALSKMYAAGLGTPRDLPQAFKWALIAAKRSSAPAQTSLGRAFEFGLGTDKSKVGAASWYQKAADQGLPDAQYRLALLILNGWTKDVSKGYALLMTAADHGNFDAQLTAGELYYFGLRGKSDDEIAKKWLGAAAMKGSSAARYLQNFEKGPLGGRLKKLEKLAAAGDPQAQSVLGQLHETGLLLPQSYDIAISLYTKASEKDDADAAYRLGSLYVWGLGGPQKNASEAFKLFQKGAKAGNSQSQYMAGSAYLLGDGVAQDSTQAAALFAQSAGSHNCDGQVGRAICLERADGVKLDVNAAQALSLAAAKQGDPFAQNHYADCLAKYSQDSSLGDALAWRQKAADSGFLPAKYSLSLANMLGLGGSGVNSKKSNTYMQECADAGNIEAMRDLANNYRFGFFGIKENKDKAVELYMKAGNEGDSQSQIRLGDMYRLAEVGGAKDKAKACKWYKMAAAQGNDEGVAKVKKHCQAGTKDDTE